MGIAEMQLLVRAAVARLAPVAETGHHLARVRGLRLRRDRRGCACPIGTVMSRLHHARQRVAEDLRATADFEIELWGRVDYFTRLRTRSTSGALPGSAGVAARSSLRRIQRTVQVVAARARD